MANFEDGGTFPSCPSLPPELWNMVIKWLLVDLHPRQLQSLAQVSRAFYQEINPLIYRSVWLKNHHDNAPFTRTLIERPDLAATIRELRHDDDHGTKFIESDSVALYYELQKLQNVETIIMRLREDAYKTKIYPNKEILAGYQHADSPPKKYYSFEECPAISFSLWCQNFVAPTLESGFRSLRSCHIGSDWLSNEAQTGIAFVPICVFWHPTLEEICITNGEISWVEWGPGPVEPAPYSTALKELKLLNTSISPSDLNKVLGFPKALKKLTYRGMEPVTSMQWTHMEAEFPMDSYQEAILPQRKSLEIIDMDLYWSELDWEDLTPFTSLKHLIITPYVLTGPDTPDSLRLEAIALPTTLETLTFRYERGETGLPIREIQQKIEAKKLPNLTSFTIEMPEHLDMRRGANIFITGIEQFIVFKRAFREIGVKFRIPVVPYPKRMPSYDKCSCERMEYYHRFDGHASEYLGDSDPDPGRRSPRTANFLHAGPRFEHDRPHPWHYDDDGILGNYDDDDEEDILGNYEDDNENAEVLGAPAADLYDMTLPPELHGNDNVDPDHDEPEL